MPIPQVTPPADKRELLWSQDENLARMLAASQAFQDEVGAADTLEALDHVFDWCAVSGNDFENARILIEFGPLGRALNGNWSSSGNLNAMIERKQPVFEETNAAYRESKALFMRWIGKMLSEFEERSKAVNGTILGFSPMRSNGYDLVQGPELAAASEVLEADEDGVAEADKRVLWWIEFSFQVN